MRRIPQQSGGGGGGGGGSIRTGGAGPSILSILLSSETLKNILILCVVCFVGLIALYVKNDDGSGQAANSTTNNNHHHNSIRHLMPHKTPDIYDKYHVPSRVQDLMKRNEIVGEHLSSIKAGKMSVEEAIHGTKDHTTETTKEPMTIEEISTFLKDFLVGFHKVQLQNKRAKFYEIWQAFHDYAIKNLYPWDREYLTRMPKRRFDDSIFVSLASYRDENCFNTLHGAYEMSKNPNQLFVGLVQQNCVKDCRSGVLKNLKMENVEPDEDCHELFCNSPLGKPHCDAGRVRAIHVDEDESLGPYFARYLASKLWYGEQWFMQIDSHMFFRQDWDALSVEMLTKAPSKKPVLSHYPPPDSYNLKSPPSKPAPRLCGPVFASSDLESQIIRLEGSGNYDKKMGDIPHFAPFTAAGYFVAHSDFLREVPFDPFLPWIFMGEEIIMSSRLWTSGYDIFNPTIPVLSHIYVRRHKPKFWESVHRVYTYGVHNPLQMLVLQRIKYQLGYPESSRDLIFYKSVLTAVEQYSMGTERPVDDYLKMVGLNMTTKIVSATPWCTDGTPPPGFEQYAHLYK